MTIQLRQITLREILLPLKEPFQISSGIVKDRRICVLELHDVAGISAWSECVAGDFPNYSPETIDTAWIALKDWIAPRVLGRKFSDPREVSKVLDADFRGHSMAKAAVEMGMWEIAAQMKGVSLANMLGGVRPSIEVGISLGICRTPEDLAAKVADSLSRGYRKIKIKIMPEKDVHYVRHVRKAVGAKAPLMVDANNAYRLEDAEHLREFDEYGLLMIEQPLSWDDMVRHAKLQKIVKTPICLDESITSLEKAEDMITLESGRIINIKPGRVGGFQMSIAIHDLCASHQIPVWCGGMLESGIGRAYNVALASLQNFVLPGDLSPSGRYWAHDIVFPEWTMDANGMVAVPMDKPGIGVEIDRDRIESLMIRRQVITKQ